MKAIVKVDSIGKGTITHEDRTYFSDVKIGGEGNDQFVYVEYTDGAYLNKWVDRLKYNNTYVSGPLLDNQFISAATRVMIGDTDKRLNDAFALIQFLLLALTELYARQDVTIKDKMTDSVANALDAFIALRGKDPELFSIDSKDSFSSALNTLMDNEKTFKKIVDDCPTNEVI